MYHRHKTNNLNLHDYTLVCTIKVNDEDDDDQYGSSASNDPNEWRSEAQPIVVNEFTQHVGPRISVGSILEVFYAFFTNSLLLEIVRQTNLYAEQCYQLQNKDGTWETSAEEIAAYLGITILMGINRRPDLYDYWSTSPDLHCFPIASILSRRRFLEIKRYLHFVDNTTLPVPCPDKLAKVRPVLESIKSTCLTNYVPNRENSIYEAMIKFKGRSSVKQYMPKKPIKRGIKSWVRADSHNGYICDFQIYCGKEGDSGTNLGTRVVTSLSETLKHQYYHLYFDNFFSSVDLMETLLHDGIYACGTYRKDTRGLPPTVVHTKIGMFTEKKIEYIT